MVVSNSRLVVFVVRGWWLTVSSSRLVVRRIGDCVVWYEDGNKWFGIRVL